jgi:predicted site-specific integrase-resolvase
MIQFMSNLSPYNFIKKYNEANGTQLKPQMAYNYIKKGYIVASTNELGKLYVSPEAQYKFIQARKAKADAKAAEVEAELAGK